MSESKHTPGPWRWGGGWHDAVEGARLQEETDDEFAGPKYADCGLYAGEKPLLPIGLDHYRPHFDGDFTELSDADRNLIAAAPDLLEACKMSLRMAEPYEGCVGCEPQEDLCGTLRSAIAKAEAHQKTG